MSPDALGRYLPQEVADRLGIHVNTVRNWVASGFLKADRLPASGFIRVPAPEVERVETIMLTLRGES